MMKTKGCEEKWDFTSWNHYAKILLNERPDISSSFSRSRNDIKKGKENSNSQFLLFSLYEKRDFYSNSFFSSLFPPSSSSSSSADCRGFLKWKTKSGLKNINDILTIFRTFVPCGELDPKLNWWSQLKETWMNVGNFTGKWTKNIYGISQSDTRIFESFWSE